MVDKMINREIPEFSIVLISEEGFSVFRLNIVPLRRAANRNKATSRCETQFSISLASPFLYQPVKS